MPLYTYRGKGADSRRVEKKRNFRALQAYQPKFLLTKRLKAFNETHGETKQGKEASEDGNFAFPLGEQSAATAAAQSWQKVFAQTQVEYLQK